MTKLLSLPKKYLFKDKQLHVFDIVWLLGLAFLTFVLLVFLLRRNEYIDVTVKVTNDDILYSQRTPPAWFPFLFQEGMSEKDGLGRTTAEIKKVFVYDDSPEGELHERKGVHLLLRIRATYNKRKNQYSYKGKPLLVGTPIKVEFERILTNALVTGIEGINDPRKTLELVVDTQVIDYQSAFPSTRGVEPFITEAIKVGDTVKDLNDEVIVTVLEKQVTPAKRVSVDASGRALLVQDPIKKDLYLKLKLMVKEVSGEYYLFDDIKVTVSRRVPIHFNNLSVFPTVTKIHN